VLTVKICGIRDAKTAQWAFSEGADYVGLVVTPSPRQLSLAEVRHILASVPGRFVAVGKDVSEDLFRTLLDLPVAAIQLHGRVPDRWIDRVHDQGKRAIATTLDPAADVVLLDGPVPGSGQVRSWERPRFSRPIWIAGGLSPDNVRQVVVRLKPDGVDVSSGVERQGQKDWELIARFIKEARHGDASA
jgi:phosphoribosylanthranilate isomerase